MAKLNTKAAAARIKARTAEIKVGGEYFLSSFGETSGAFVKVVNKSTKLNRCGWPSTVTVEVTEAIHEGAHPDSFHMKHYAPGTIHTCNATNLYDSRYLASPQGKRAPGGKYATA